MPATRDLAFERKAQFFFTGRPCRRGHIAPRYSSTGQCIDCQAHHYQEKRPPRQRVRSGDICSHANEILSQRGGHLIAGNASAAKIKIVVACAGGHIFETDYDRLKQGKWCRRCSASQRGKDQRRYTVEDMQRIAAERGGEFKSATFLGVKQKHEFCCTRHGSFQATPDNVIHTDQWCPVCWDERRGEAIRRPFEDISRYVAERGGEFVSNVDQYETLRSRVRVRCADGHEWDVTAASLVQANSWCPHCGDTIGETITRRIFEATYGVRFQKCRPEFLKTDAGGRLELDGYNPALALAFEYQGPYHELPDQMERDQVKRRRCAERAITLLEIPYVSKPYPPENVLAVVTEVISALDPGKSVRLPEEDLFRKKLTDLREIANSRGGHLIGDQYLGEMTKHVWKCANPDHPSWAAPPSNIRKGHWCGHCAGVARKDLKWLEQFAAQHGLTVRASEYVGAQANYGWVCRRGHALQTTMGVIRQRVRTGLDACRLCASIRSVARG